MNEDQIQALLGLVNAYVAAYDARDASNLRGSRRLWISAPVYNEYHDLLDFVLAFPISVQRYSNKSIESFVDTMLDEVLSTTIPTERAVRNLAVLLNHDLQTRLYIPIDGLTSDSPVYEIGALRLVKMTEDAFETLIVEPFADAMHANVRYDAANQNAFIERHRRELMSLIGRICAEVTTALDIQRTFSFAVDTAIDDLCDFLQFAASIFLAHDKRLKIAWATDVPNALRHSFATSNDPQMHSSRHTEAAGVGHPFELVKDRLEKLTDLGLARIANIVGREAPTDYDDLLRRAVRWFAKGERESNPDDRKLSYVTAVDLFFSDAPNGATRRICKGFAFALAANDEAVPGVASFMFHMFKSRSVTAHTGALGVMSDDDLISLRWHVQQFIIAMARKPFSSKGEVSAWCTTSENALSPGLRLQLHETTDWKIVLVKQYFFAISSVLRRFIKDTKMESQVLERGNAILTALRDHAKDGKALHKIEPLLASLDNIHDQTVEQLESGAVTPADANTYLEAVFDTLKSVDWIKRLA